jgi:protein phosphatase
VRWLTRGPTWDRCASTTRTFLVARLTRRSRGLSRQPRDDRRLAGRVFGLRRNERHCGRRDREPARRRHHLRASRSLAEHALKRDELARLVRRRAAGLRIFTKRGTGRGAGWAPVTIAALWTTPVRGQVGDSRAYILRGERLVQVTRDQSLVNQLIEAGQLTEEEAETFEHNNIILQALGTADTVQVDLTCARSARATS